jgi:hypothetical protein
MSKLGFDPDEYEPTTGFEPFPFGEYVLKVVRIDSEPAFAGYDDRRNYNIGFQVVEGPHTGRWVWTYFTFHGGKSEKQVIYCRRLFKGLLLACYKQRVDDPDELKGLICRAEVIIDSGKDKDGVQRRKPSNRIDHFPIPDDMTIAPVKAAPSATTPAAATDDTPAPNGTAPVPPPDAGRVELDDDIPF